MRKAALTLLFTTLSVVLSAQVIITPADAIGFDYPDATLVEYQVSHFQASWDGSQTWVDIPATGGFKDSGTLANHSTYRAIPPFSGGNHTLMLRTCNAFACGTATSPFAFAYAVSSAPAGAPVNLRKVAR